MSQSRKIISERILKINSLLAASLNADDYSVLQEPNSF